MIFYFKVVEIVRVVDGDTIWAKVDLGFNVTLNVDFRLYGINTPEVVGPTKTAGLAAKDELIRLLALGPVRVASTKSDKYGRWLGTFYVQQGTAEINVNEELLAKGFALRYDGKGPKPI